MHPVIGVDFDLKNVSFTPQTTLEAAKKWAAHTAPVATKTTVHDVYLAASRKPSDATTMTLVVDPARNARGYVLNLSHTLASQAGYEIMQEYMTQLALTDSELGLDAIFTPETVAGARPRLPQSLCHAYARHYQPTPQDLQEVMRNQEEAQARWARSSVGIPVHPDWQNRPSRIHTKVLTFEPWETLAARKCLKQMRLTLTTAFFACITSAIANTFPTGEEEGAHLLFSGNARRWLDFDGDGQGPVTMGIIPGGMWIDGREANVRATDKQGLIRLAKAIERAQDRDFASPHIIALWDQMAPALAQAMGAPQVPAATPMIGRPTLTSQGIFDDNRVAKPGVDAMRMADCNSGGRNTDPGVCFAMNSFRGELRYNLLFDEKYFVQDDIMQLAYRVSGLFRRLTAEEPVQARL